MSTPQEIAAAHDKLLAALFFYSEPENYHAIAFFADPPAGAFMDDFDENHGHHFYDRPMPGKMAREALAAWNKIIYPEGPV